MFSLHIPLIAILLALHVCAEDTYYAIWPKDSSDFETNNKIRDDLNVKVGVDKIYASESATIGFLYWYQQLNAELLDHYSKFPGVSYVSPPCDQPYEQTGKHPSCGTPFRALESRANPNKSGSKITQPNSPDQLKVLSQAPDQALKDVEGYTYDDTAGQDVRVYIIDSGVNLDHPDLKDNKIEWMFPGPKPLTGQKNDKAIDSHGTCMSSMVAGATLGTAKKAPITMLKVPFAADQEAWTVERTIDALVMIYDDIMLKELQGKAVVSMSWGITNDLNPKYVNAFKAAYKYLMDALLKIDVLPVISAGQDASADINNPLNHYPALLGKDDARITVVAAVDNAGNPYEGGLYEPSFVKVSGPGEHLKCANKEGDYDYNVDGSSAPTAMTAGLLADFITGFGMTPVQARNHLYDEAHNRVKDGRNVIYYSFDMGGPDAEAAKMDSHPPV